jgi:hypothetical protein
LHATANAERPIPSSAFPTSNDGALLSLDPGPALDALAKDLAAAATRLRAEKPRIAAVVERIAATVEAASELPVAALEEHLFALESALLATCLDALDESDRQSIEKRARREAEATAATPDAGERAFRALRDRLLRSELGLPRLELEG